MRFFKSSLFILFLFLASACSSTYYQINTLEKEFEIEKNKEIIYLSDSLYDISVNFHNLENNHLDFFVYIYNKTDNTLELIPSNISVEYLNSFELFDSKKPTFTSYALNPENEIEIIDGNIVSINKEKSFLSCLNCLGASLSLVGIFTSKASSGQKIAEFIGTAIEYIGNQTHLEKTTDLKIDDLHKRKYFWENSVLKNIILYKNEDIGGRILVRFNEKYPFFRLVIPLRLYV